MGETRRFAPLAAPDRQLAHACRQLPRCTIAPQCSLAGIGLPGDACLPAAIQEREEGWRLRDG